MKQPTQDELISAIVSLKGQAVGIADAANHLYRDGDLERHASMLEHAQNLARVCAWLGALYEEEFQREMAEDAAKQR